MLYIAPLTRTRAALEAHLPPSIVGMCLEAAFGTITAPIPSADWTESPTEQAPGWHAMCHHARAFAVLGVDELCDCGCSWAELALLGACEGGHPALVRAILPRINLTRVLTRVCGGYNSSAVRALLSGIDMEMSCVHIPGVRSAYTDALCAGFRAACIGGRYETMSLLLLRPESRNFTSPSAHEFR